MKLNRMLTFAVFLFLSIFSFTSQANEIVELDANSIINKVSEIKGGPIIFSGKSYRAQHLKGVLLSTDKSFEQLSDEEIENLFHTILASNNFGLAYSNDIYSIVPTNQLRNDTSVILEEGQKGKMFGLAVIRSEHVPVNDLVAILRPLIAKYGHIAPEHSTSSIILMDHADNVERFRQLVKVLNDMH